MFIVEQNTLNKTLKNRIQINICLVIIKTWNMVFDHLILQPMRDKFLDFVHTTNYIFYYGDDVGCFFWIGLCNIFGVWGSLYSHIFGIMFVYSLFYTCCFIACECVDFQFEKTTIKRGDNIVLTVGFTNPLDLELTKCSFTVEGTGFKPANEHLRLVPTMHCHR